MKNTLSRFSLISVILMLSFVISCNQQEEKVSGENKVKDDLQPNKMPQVVMDALKSKFPKAQIHKLTKEKEGDIVVYDIEFKQEGRSFEADIKEDGVIHNWEKAIELSDLPEAVNKTFETKYPNSTINEIMEITAVIDGKDTLEGYEIVLENADKLEVEITVSPAGTILEDSSEKKGEEE